MTDSRERPVIEPGWGLKDFRQESGGVGDDVPVDQPERACGIVRVEGEADHVRTSSPERSDRH